MEKRESIANRFRRVLGRTLPDTENPESQSEYPDGQPSSRRREQILQAQRTHRHRTQQYIRELEKEVFRLRDENEDLRRAMERMHTERGRMGGDLIEHSDNAAAGEQRQLQPPQSNSPSQTSPLSSSVTVDLTGLADVIPVGSCENNANQASPPKYQPRYSHPIQLPNTNTSTHDNPPPLPTQLGITFILTLEQPCLAHIKHAHMGFATGTTPSGVTYNSGPGHALNVSSGLTRRYYRPSPSSASAPQNSEEQQDQASYGQANQFDLTSSPFQISTDEIERLLAASARLRLDGEVTPVQIWERVREIHRLTAGINGGGGVDEETVERLARVLADFVYCNSFGAVVEKGTVEAILSDMFG